MFVQHDQTIFCNFCNSDLALLVCIGPYPKALVSFAFQFNQKFNVMLGFFQVSNAIFLSPPGNVFDNITFTKPQTVGMDVLNGLDCFVFVMRPRDLFIKRIHGGIFLLAM